MQADHACLDLLSLVIWSPLFWPCIVWNLRKAQSWSKKVLTFDRCRQHSWLLQGFIIEWWWGKYNHVICKMVKIFFSTSIIQRRRVGSALAYYKVHLYGHNFHCVLYVNREEESRRLVKSLQRQLIEVKREKESEIHVSQVYLQYYTPNVHLHYYIQN